MICTKCGHEFDEKANRNTMAIKRNGEKISYRFCLECRLNSGKNKEVMDVAHYMSSITGFRLKIGFHLMGMHD